MKPVVKISLLAGGIFGAVLGIAVSLSIDFMMGDSPGGGWYDSVKHDIDLFFGPEWAQKEWAVYAGVCIVIGLIGVAGSVIGAVFGGITGRILSFMAK